MNEDDFNEIEQKILDNEAAEVETIELAKMTALFHQTLIKQGIDPLDAIGMTGCYMMGRMNPPKK